VHVNNSQRRSTSGLQLTVSRSSDFTHLQRRAAGGLRILIRHLLVPDLYNIRTCLFLRYFVNLSYNCAIVSHLNRSYVRCISASILLILEPRSSVTWVSGMYVGYTAGPAVRKSGQWMRCGVIGTCQSIICHFRQFKALIVTSVTHVSCAIASTRTVPDIYQPLNGSMQALLHQNIGKCGCRGSEIKVM